MSFAEAELWAPAVDNLLHGLEAGVVRGALRCYPNEPATRHRVTRRLTHGELLRDLVGAHFNDSLDQHKLDEQMLVLARVDWASKHVIRAFQVQAFVVEGACLEDVALADPQTCRAGDVHYYRCECDPAAPGRLFAEPFPHVHTRAEHGPRFPFANAPDENPILSFIEFLYLNHAYDVWSSWARQVCSRQDLLESMQTMDTIHKIGCTGEDIEKLLGAEAAKDLSLIKDAIWDAKRRLFPWRLQANAGYSLSYWSHPHPARAR